MTGNATTSQPDIKVAYIAGGKLYLAHPDGTKREVTSDFAQGLIDRSEQRRQRNEWKSGSFGWNSTSAPPEMVSLGMANQGQGGQRQVNMITTVPLDEDRLLYALQTDTIGGLFEYSISRAEERRLAHRTDFRIGELDAHPSDERLIASLAYPDGTANLASMRPGGGGIADVTEGDSVDQSPSWAADEDNAIVYQSAGIARDQHGGLAGLSTFRIEWLDFDNDRHDVLAESDDNDLLAPRIDKDGTLYYIRRPYQELVPARTPWTMLKDLLMFPILLGVAIFWFLNAFSLLFARKPLTSADGPKTEGPNTRRLVLYGRVIEAHKAQKNNNKTGTAAVPKTWELVRRTKLGDEKTLATGVGHYDLAPDDAILFTNGVKIWHLSADGTQTEILKDSLIERVSVIV